MLRLRFLLVELVVVLLQQLWVWTLWLLGYGDSQKSATGPQSYKGSKPTQPRAIAVVWAEVAVHDSAVQQLADILEWCTNEDLEHFCVYDPCGELKARSQQFQATLRGHRCSLQVGWSPKPVGRNLRCEACRTTTKVADPAQDQRTVSSCGAGVEADRAGETRRQASPGAAAAAAMSAARADMEPAPLEPVAGNGSLAGGPAAVAAARGPRGGGPGERTDEDVVAAVQQPCGAGWVDSTAHASCACGGGPGDDERSGPCRADVQQAPLRPRGGEEQPPADVTEPGLEHGGGGSEGSITSGSGTLRAAAATMAAAATAAAAATVCSPSCDCGPKEALPLLKPERGEQDKEGAPGRQRQQGSSSGDVGGSSRGGGGGSSVCVRLLAAEDGYSPMLQAARSGGLCSGCGALLPMKGDTYREGLAQLRSQMEQLAGPAVLVEPELVMVVGPVLTLAGYPPFQVAASEIIHLGPAARLCRARVDAALTKFLRTEQRFGK